MELTRESGQTNPLLIMAVVFGILTVGFGGFGVWAFVNYQDQKNNVDSKISAAVIEAEKVQTETDKAAFAEQEKSPTRQIVGPADLGNVTLSYPKTWSAYVDRNGTGNNATYEAYFHPSAVPPLASDTPYALRTSVTNAKYETVLASFNERIKSGQITASPVKIADVDGMRFDGAFSNTVRGSMVVFKIRDKTLQVYTQSETYKSDFDTYILKSLTFNK